LRTEEMIARVDRTLASLRRGGGCLGRSQPRVPTDILWRDAAARLEFEPRILGAGPPLVGVEVLAGDRERGEMMR
jgi:hypothetical protein